MEILSINDLQVRYFACNCLEIKFPTGKTLVVDPCLHKDGQFGCGHDVSVLEGADYVFVNHTHIDHVDSLGEVYERFHPLVLAMRPSAMIWLGSTTSHLSGLYPLLQGTSTILMTLR